MRDWHGRIMEGHIMPQKTRQKMSNNTSFKRGHIPYNKGKKCPEISLRQMGKDNPAWNGGITSENQQIRNSEEYKEWRKKVLFRDNYTCQHCLKKHKYLVAHHNYYFSEIPEIRYSIKNGITLCHKCHWNLHRRNKPLDKMFHKIHMKPENYQFIVGQNI